MTNLGRRTQRDIIQPSYPDVIQEHFDTGTCTSSLLVRMPFGSLAGLICHRAPYIYELVVNSFICSGTPSVPSTDEGGFLTEGFETTQTYPPPWAANLSWHDGISLGNIGSRVGFSFEDMDVNVPREEDLLLAGSIAPSQMFNTISTGDPLAPPIMSVVEPSQSAASGMVHHRQVPLASPVPKYRCETCQKTFDRISRLENCRNQHSVLRPHECFGVCGSTGWYVTPSSIHPVFSSSIELNDPCSSPARYASIEQLNRHITRLVLCSSW
jgi:hypothetical protein